MLKSYVSLERRKYVLIAASTSIAVFISEASICSLIVLWCKDFLFLLVETNENDAVEDVEWGLVRRGNCRTLLTCSRIFSTVLTADRNDSWKEKWINPNIN